MNTVVSNVRTRVAKVRRQALAAGLNMPKRSLAAGLNMPKRSLVAGLSADAGTRNSALAVHGFVVRVGAVLAVFMLAFSLLMPATPAHAADSIRIWVHVKIDGDKIYVSSKTHALNQHGQSTRSMCFKDSTHAKLVNYLGAEVTKAEVEQYQGIEVCAVEGVGSLKKALQGGDGYGFVFKADGDNVRVTGSVRAAVTYDGNIIHSFTFAGGIVSHEGGKVDGNTITINTGDYELVGNPGSGKANQTPFAAPSQNKAAGADNAKNQASDDTKSGSSGNTLIYALIGVIVAAVVGLVVFLAIPSKKRSQPAQLTAQPTNVGTYSPSGQEQSKGVKPGKYDRYGI